MCQTCADLAKQLNAQLGVQIFTPPPEPEPQSREITDEDIATLTGEGEFYRWNKGADVGTPTVVTYSFGDDEADYNDLGEFTGYRGFNEVQKGFARDALDAWADVSGLTFVEVPDDAGGVGGQIRFTQVDPTPLEGPGTLILGFAFFPYEDDSGEPTDGRIYNGLDGDIFLNSDLFADADNRVGPGSLGYYTLLHEIGHAIGFKHPFEETPTLPGARDNTIFSIMSYSGPQRRPDIGLIDVEAVQYYYGEADEDFVGAYDAAADVVTITGHAGPDTVFGTPLDDSLAGAGGADTLQGGVGDDILDGGAGQDTAVYEEVSGTYEVFRLTERGPNGEAVIEVIGPDDPDLVATPEGTDRLIGIETLLFEDGPLAAADVGFRPLSAEAAQTVALLYEAVLGGVDVAGLNFWIDRREAGLSEAELAGAFLASDPFAARFGAPDSLDDTALVEAFYEEILGRAADEGGTAVWTGRLADPGFDRADLLLAFAESPENRTQAPEVETLALTEEGTWGFA